MTMFIREYLFIEHDARRYFQSVSLFLRIHDRTFVLHQSCLLIHLKFAGNPYRNRYAGVEFDMETLWVRQVLTSWKSKDEEEEAYYYYACHPPLPLSLNEVMIALKKETTLGLLRILDLD